MNRSNRSWLVLVVSVLATAGTLAAAAPWADSYETARRVYQNANDATDLEMVVALCEQALQRGCPPRRQGEVQFLRGRAAYDAKQSLVAVTALRSAVEAEPKLAEYRLWLGYAYFLDGRPTHAARLFKALRQSPDTDEAVRKSSTEWLEALHEPVPVTATEPAATMSVPGGLVRYHLGEPFVVAIREALAAARQQLSERLQVEVTEPVEVVLLADADEYRRYLSARKLPRPEWSTACTVNGRIFTYPAAGARDGFKATLAHEYTHVALRAYADDRALPCWLDEGLAVLLSGQFPSYRDELRATRGLLSLEALLVDSFGAYERQMARLAYLQSKAMAEDLLLVHGPMKLRAYLRALGLGQTIEAAFEATYQVTMRDFYQWWFTERVDGR